MRLHGPLGSFGREMVDTRGPTADAPAKSMLVGLLASALGWKRTMHAEHQALQERLVYACLWENGGPGPRLTDYQSARLGWRDRAWTTDGRGGGRGGGESKYENHHLRWREYHSDLRVAVVARLDRETERPTLDELAAALDRPARPLFLGRKCCPPTRPIFDGWVTAVLGRNALEAIAPARAGRLTAFWPEDEGGRGTQAHVVTDERDWRSGLHGGTRTLWEGSVKEAG